MRNAGNTNSITGRVKDEHFFDWWRKITKLLQFTMSMHHAYTRSCLEHFPPMLIYYIGIRWANCFKRYTFMNSTYRSGLLFFSYVLLWTFICKSIQVHLLTINIYSTNVMHMFIQSFFFFMTNSFSGSFGPGACLRTRGQGNPGQGGRPSQVIYMQKYITIYGSDTLMNLKEKSALTFCLYMEVRGQGQPQSSAPETGRDSVSWSRTFQQDGCLPTRGHEPGSCG